MDALDIDPWYITTHQGMRAPVAEARMATGNRVQPTHQFLVAETTWGTWPIAQAGMTAVAERTTATERQPARLKLADGRTPLLRAAYFFPSTSSYARSPSSGADYSQLLTEWVGAILAVLAGRSKCLAPPAT